MKLEQLYLSHNGIEKIEGLEELVSEVKYCEGLFTVRSKIVKELALELYIVNSNQLHFVLIGVNAHFVRLDLVTAEYMFAFV